MRPLRIKSNKNINRKIPKKKYLYKKKRFWGSSHITNADLENINQVLYKQKKQLAKDNYCSWKVMPKDSCEIYKKRYQRQVERRRRSSERFHNSEKSDDSENKHVKRESSRRVSQRCRCRKRSRRRSSTLSQYTTTENSSIYSSETETSN